GWSRRAGTDGRRTTARSWRFWKIMTTSVTKTTLAATGGVVAAVVSTLCCAGPLVAVALGLSGAGLAAPFEPLRHYFVAGTLLESAGPRSSVPCASRAYRRPARSQCRSLRRLRTRRPFDFTSPR